MEDLNDFFKPDGKEPDPGITIYKYLVELTLYPNGKMFHRMIPLGKNTRADKGKKRKFKKKLEEAEIVDEEVY